MVLKLTVASGAYDRVTPLRTGDIRPEGVELNWIVSPVEDIFWRMMRYREFDASEMSLSGYVIRRARGVDDLIAIPVFLSRNFRHYIVYVNKDAGIEKPEDLRGRRVGVPEYQITAATWVRAFLDDDYGVRPEDIEWVQGGVEEWGRKPFEPVQPKGVTIVEPSKGKALAHMLADGEIDALVTARIPSTFDESGDGPVRRLFHDPSAAARDYYARTGIFPIMHTVVIRRELIDENPWLSQSLLKAFNAAKEQAIRNLRDTTVPYASLPFIYDYVEDTERAMGYDYWPYGLEPNRPTLELFLRQAFRQGLIGEPLSPEDLFPEGTWHYQPI